MRKRIYTFLIAICTLTNLLFIGCNDKETGLIGQTEVTKWSGNKKSAISITYDDGIINQFTVARPIMNELKLPGTFFVLTGKIPGSKEGKFIGRVAQDIIEETSRVKTDESNFFERASLIGFTGTSDGVLYHSKVGALFEAGDVSQAYTTLDSAYYKLRNSELKNTDDIVFHDNVQDTTTWDDLRNYALEGHEIASHSITHPRMAVLDKANLNYELEQSRADILTYLGEEYTFSVECPYGTENERVMAQARSVYPALRNRMPEFWLDELNRSSNLDPASSKNEYVQWQRGPLSDTPMDLMKSWVDKCLSRDNIWLVLVFHGVDHLGWEPKTADELEEYFTYIKDRENDLWVATFGDVTKYIRQRKNIRIKSEFVEEHIHLSVELDLNPETYDIPMTLKTYIPESWKKVKIDQDGSKEASILSVNQDELGSYLLFEINPYQDELVISKDL